MKEKFDKASKWIIHKQEIIRLISLLPCVHIQSTKPTPSCYAILRPYSWGKNRIILQGANGLYNPNLRIGTQTRDMDTI